MLREFGTRVPPPLPHTLQLPPPFPPQNAPKTGFHKVEDDLRDEALAKFFECPCQCTPTTGGVNNVVKWVFFWGPPEGWQTSGGSKRGEGLHDRGC